MTTKWRSRLSRANEHLEEVQREIERFLGTKPYQVVQKSKKNAVIKNVINHTIRGSALHTPPPRLGDVIGDCVENLRSCLDLIAYELARYADTPPQGTEFPIFWNVANYSHVNANGVPRIGSGLYKVRGMSPAAQTVIETLQPYHGIDPADYAAAGVKVVPESVLRRPLYLIHNLRQVNFHREPHVTGAVTSNIGMGFNTFHDLDMVINPSGAGIKLGAFDDGALLGMIQFTVRGPHPIVQMNLDPTFDVAFEPKGPARGQPVISTLQSLCGYVETVVFPKLEPFV